MNTLISLFEQIPNDPTGISLFVSFFFLVMIIAFILAVILFIIAAIGLHRLAANASMPNAWMAFIPFLHAYLLGKVVQDQCSQSFADKLPIILLVANIGCYFASAIPVVGTIVYILSAIVFFYACYLLFAKYTTTPAVLLVVSIVTLGIVVPFIILAIRNHPPVHYRVTDSV